MTNTSMACVVDEDDTDTSSLQNDTDMSSLQNKWTRQS